MPLAKADEVARWIAGLGFPEPVRADSGNGAHLLYRIDLPNDEAATALVKSCLATLDALFSDERVTVDTANFNAARIWKLYGTVSRKGDNTPDRPHRRSRILSAPDELKSRDDRTAQGSRGPAPDRAARTAATGAWRRTRASTCAAGSPITGSVSGPRNRTAAARSSSSTSARSRRPTRTGPLRSSSATARSLPAASTLPAAAVPSGGRNSASGSSRTGQRSGRTGSRNKRPGGRTGQRRRSSMKVRSMRAGPGRGISRCTGRRLSMCWNTATRWR